MSSKLLDSKKRNHADKILQKMSKRASADTSKPVESTATRSSKAEATLSEQYDVIRSDILKLRDDLSKGYDMAKGMIEKKGFINQLLKAK